MNDTRNAIHVGLTSIMAWLGLYFDISDHVFYATKGFAYMAAVAPEHVWALLFLGIANVGVLGLITSNPVLCLASVLVVASGNGLFAGCLIMSGASVWSGTYAIIAAMGYYLAWRRAHAGL